MDDHSRRLRHRTLEGMPLCGTWLNLGSAVAAEIASLAGLDWVLIDLEHGSGGWNTLPHLIWASQGGGAATVVRVPELNAAGIKHALDWGPDGVMIPNVESPRQARRAVAAVRIPPLGGRGAATSTRASRYGYGYADYLKSANGDVLLVLQIESAAGLAAVQDIAAVEGVDVLFVGPVDLSVSLGIESPDTDPRFTTALERVAAGARSARKACGILARNPAQARRYFELGFSFVAMGSDRGLLASGFRKCSEELRAAAGTLRTTP